MWLVGSPAPQLDDEVLGFVHVLHLLNWAGSQTGGFQSLFCPLYHVTMASVSSLSLSVLDCEWDRLSDFEEPLPRSLLEKPRPFHSPPSTMPACLRWMWPRRKVAFMKVLSHRWHYTEGSSGKRRISSPESSRGDSPSINTPIPWEPCAASQTKSLIYKVRQ